MNDILAERLLTFHIERDWRPLDGTYPGGTVCNHCRTDWPCSTVRVIRELSVHD